MKLSLETSMGADGLPVRPTRPDLTRFEREDGHERDSHLVFQAKRMVRLARSEREVSLEDKDIYLEFKLFQALKNAYQLGQVDCPNGCCQEAADALDD